MSWPIEYRPDVIEVDIPLLPKAVRQQVADAIEKKLGSEPLMFGKPLRHNLSGLRSLRVGDYRVIYLIDPIRRCVVITAIDHRKDVYE
ncbi:MAG: type II toxin-antitoxin system RelE/ParE family toxin [Alphaproteobacteria bacterium]|nr:type II toxin-antitoxin system RelE/ParE family toxin [Alphaproteobacteria bacterium]